MERSINIRIPLWTAVFGNKTYLPPKVYAISRWILFNRKSLKKNFNLT